MKRMSAAILIVLSLAIGALTVAQGAAASSTPTAPVAGVWTTIDAGDGSVMYMVIGSGRTPSMFFYDTVVGKCGPGPGWWTGSATITGDTLTLTLGAIQCLNGTLLGNGGGHQFVWTYNPQTDTIATDTFFGNGITGDTWHRLF